MVLIRLYSNEVRTGNVVTGFRKKLYPVYRPYRYPVTNVPGSDLITMMKAIIFLICLLTFNVTVPAQVKEDPPLRYTLSSGRHSICLGESVKFTRSITNVTKKPVVIEKTMRPLDIDSLPIQEQAIAALLSEGFENQISRGVREPAVTLTPDMVKAKVKELRAAKKRKR